MRRKASFYLELLPGTLDMLILKTLTREPSHGYAIAQQIQRVSEDALKIGEGSLYPALQRLLLNGWVKAEWGTSESHRRVRFYRITLAGRRQLASEAEDFDLMIHAVARVMGQT
jgi:PadR family transcriptional regulator, regulatory protein PadR